MCGVFASRPIFKKTDLNFRNMYLFGNMVQFVGLLVQHKGTTV